MNPLTVGDRAIPKALLPVGGGREVLVDRVLAWIEASGITGESSSSAPSVPAASASLTLTEQTSCSCARPNKYRPSRSTYRLRGIHRRHRPITVPANRRARSNWTRADVRQQTTPQVLVDTDMLQGPIIIGFRFLSTVSTSESSTRRWLDPMERTQKTLPTSEIRRVPGQMATISMQTTLWCSALGL